MRKPFFYDITLRDGNQSLKRPWDTKEKEIVFNHLLELGVQGIEVGFAAASDMDFEACSYLAQTAPDNVVISSLARTIERDIIAAAKAIEASARPRIHTFITMSPFNMEHVLNKTPDEVRRLAIEAVSYAKSILPKNGEVQFSAEHFGDCLDNMPWVLETLKEVVKAGADVINLPNTVERYRVKYFVDMVERVYSEIGNSAIIAVHCHNDLGMASAATVESYFAGAIQLECCLNGLGERAGNTNMYEVAIALHNSGVEVPLNLEKIYETALVVSEMSGVRIYDKAPLIGFEALAHRSGIHQDGAVKTKDMKKGAYRPIHPSLIGREDDEKLGFTSQSGKTAVFEIVSSAGYPITMQEAVRIAPKIKEAAEKVGELKDKELIDIYLKEIFEPKGDFVLISFEKSGENLFSLEFSRKGKKYCVDGEGNGPLAACLNALETAGFPQKLLHYEQQALDEDILGSEATAMSVIEFEGPSGESIIARAKDSSTAKANVKAVFNGLNIISKIETSKKQKSAK